MTHSVVPASVPASEFLFGEISVRVIKVEGEARFAATDVAKALEYRDAHNLIRFIDDDEGYTHTVSTPSKNQHGEYVQDANLLFLTESGLYHAILKSRKKEAKNFRKWVTSEVLPAIRSAGRYEAAVKPADEQEDDFGIEPSMEVLPLLFKGYTIRIVVDEERKVWFVMNDVATAIGYKATTHMGSMPNKNEKSAYIIKTPGGYQKLNFVSEIGLQRICRKSRKLAADDLRHFVIKELLPEIRETGHYVPKVEVTQKPDPTPVPVPQRQNAPQLPATPHRVQPPAEKNFPKALQSLREEEKNAIYFQAWEDAIDCLKLGFALRRRDIKEQ